MNTVINKTENFHRYCDLLEKAKFIAFDTEFVGEDYYRPKLCLIQVATEDSIEIIDPLSVDDVDRFWEILTEGDHTTILHAGQHEMQFCLGSVDRRPKKLFDVQLAAGLIGWEYPASYTNLVSRLLGVKLKKSQSRTDWRRRPLNEAQLKYAAEDVIHLISMHDKLSHNMIKLGRLDWMEEEVDRVETRVRHSDSDERWRKTAGIASMTPSQLGIVRGIWKWREAKAAEHNRPAKRILRDDLMVELARLGSDTPAKIKSIREMTQQRFAKHVDEIANAISSAIATPDDQLPTKVRKPRNPNFGLAGQFLNVVLSAICRENSIAPGLVGSVQEIHNLIAWHELKKQDDPPFLAHGWRGELIGNQLKQALDGKVRVRMGKVKGELVPIVEII